MADLSGFKKITNKIASFLNAASGSDPGSHFMSAVIVAGGSGTRMGGVSKQLMEIGGRKVVEYSLEAFEKSEYTSEIVLVVREDEKSVMEALVSSGGFGKVSRIVCGGDSRQRSAENGFFAVDKRCEYVAIHDACRPLITGETIDALWKKALLCDSCAAASKVTDTVKKAGRGNVIESTVPRDDLYTVSTPQIFTKNVYSASVAVARRDSFEATDDCALAEHAGFPVTLALIGQPNYKITYPEDLQTVEALIMMRAGSADAPGEEKEE